MPAAVIIGGQWGDEGKAKIVDFLMSDHDVVVRYQGGANAGHTVVKEGKKFAFHQIPSGLLYPHTTGILGNGMVINPFSFLKELDGVISNGINAQDRLFISSSAQVVMPYHSILDDLKESDRKERKIGSTGKGIGPAYSDKHARSGMRMGDFLLEKEELFSKIAGMVKKANRKMAIYGAPELSPRKIAADFINIRDLIEHFIRDTQMMVADMNSQGKRFILEGAQGTLLDIDHGTYPYVTSSNSTVGGAITGSGIPPSALGRVIGIYKAYVTRVGRGPFPTELEDQFGDKLRERGCEFGTTTGRPRRCGWFDLVAARYAKKINGFSEIALTKLDVLSGIEKLKICHAYEIDGERIDRFPASSAILDKCRPVYTEMPGWEDGELGGNYEELPGNARKYIEKLEDELETRISFISTGPGRRETIIRE
ncbi:MAG: adenylosuccinate synthase [Candidatus Latescibacteria bacterium]|nr:adenylosuccinate synthase [bacterium]MBD3423361.1 adenylosuccinate synthase [Candidatus Latescibacterota bacterium]